MYVTLIYTPGWSTFLWCNDVKSYLLTFQNSMIWNCLFTMDLIDLVDTFFHSLAVIHLHWHKPSPPTLTLQQSLVLSSVWHSKDTHTHACWLYKNQELPFFVSIRKSWQSTNQKKKKRFFFPFFLLVDGLAYGIYVKNVDIWIYLFFLSFFN